MRQKSIENHPGTLFGNWLRRQRVLRGLVARIFAGRLSLSSAAYAEVELGITHWLTEKQESLIPTLLEFTEGQTAKFQRLLVEARGAISVAFKDIFTKTDLYPVRAAHSEGKQLTEDEVDKLLDVVFTPLPN